MAQKKRDVLQDFDGFFRDVKVQYGEQQKLIEQQIEQQNMLLIEMSDFCKKRGEIEMQYASALDKLVRRQHPHYPHSALGRTWQSMLESTRKMRDGHAVFANNYSNKICEHLTSISSHLPILFKRYRDLHNSLQQDEVARLKKFREKIDSYRQSCVRLAEDRSKAAKCSSKFGGAKPSAPADLQATPGGGATRKERELAKAFGAVDTSAQKTEQMRNEYLLSVHVENVALDRLLNSDFAYATSFLEWFFRKAMARTFRLALIGDTYSTTTQRCEDALRAAVEELDTSDLPFPRAAPPLPEAPTGNGAPQVPEAIDWNVRALVDQLWALPGDYRLTLEQSQAAFLPRSLSFEPGREDTERELHISAESSGNVLMKTSASCKEAMRDVRERILRLIPELQRFRGDLISRLAEPLDLFVSASAPNQSPLPESNFGSLDSLALLAPNTQLAHAIAKNSQDMFALADALFSRQCDYMGYERQFEIVRCKFEFIRPVLFKYSAPPTVRAAPSVPVAGPIDRAHPRREVFGVRLITYVEMTHEPIPNVVRSCLRFLTDNAMQHAGLFRVSGSQPEILDLRARFNAGEDPLDAATGVLDVNNVASLLKMYFRELPEPLIPPAVAQSLIDLRGIHQYDEARLRVELRTALHRDIPAPHYAVLRYLIEFLSNVTAYDENMMDATNLAVCFGPTITQPVCDNDREPTPPHLDDSAELVSKQRSINDLIADLIINFREVFEFDSDTVDSRNRTEVRNDRVARIRIGTEFEIDDNTADRQRHNSMHSAESASLSDLTDAVQPSIANAHATTHLAALPSNADSASESQSADEATSLSDKIVAAELDVVFKPATDTPTRKLPDEPNSATKASEPLVVSTNTRELLDGQVNVSSASPKRSDASALNLDTSRNDLSGPRAAPDGSDSPLQSSDSRSRVQKPLDEQEPARKPPPVPRKPAVTIKK